MSKYDQKIILLILNAIKEKKWGLVHELCDEYIVKYPNDNYILLVYISVLLILGRTKKARSLLDKVKLSENEHKTNIENYFKTTVKLLLQEERYEECLDYINSNDNLFHFKNEIDYVSAFCKKQLEIPIIGRTNRGYIYSQIVDYSEEKALSFIHERYDAKTEAHKSSFDPNFDIDKCFHIIKSRVSEALKLYNANIIYESVFKADNCGTFERKPTDFIAVSGFIHSNKILLISPHNNRNKQGYIDITHDLRN